VPETNGLLFSPGDHRALAELIQRAIENEPWMENARANNRKLVESKADATVNMKKLLDILGAHRQRESMDSAQSNL
jgi:glycosyltransferase involved in cell wall biosynthesis